MILKNVKDQELDLSLSEKFRNHYLKGGSYAEYLVEQLKNDELKRFFVNKNYITVIDLGGNVGLWSLYLEPICKKIFTVEPTKAHCETAEDLVNIFNLNKKIQIFNLAISNEDGEKILYTNCHNSTMNSLYKYNNFDNYEKTKTLKLKTFLQSLNEKIDFLKMDIEGSEQQVILDPDFDSFIYDSIDNIYIEIHDSLGAKYEEIYNKLKELNYKIEKIGFDTLYLHK